MSKLEEIELRYKRCESEIDDPIVIVMFEKMKKEEIENLTKPNIEQTKYEKTKLV